MDSVNSNMDSTLKVLGDYHNQALQQNDSAKLAFALFNKGLLHLGPLKDYYTGLEYFYKALRVYQDRDDQQKINGTLLQIGVCYYTQKHYQKAIDVFETLKKSPDKFFNLKGKAISYYLQGLSEIELQKYSDAEKNLNEAINYYYKVPYEQGIYEAYMGIGKIHLMKNDPDSALFYFNKALDFFSVKKENDSSIKIYSNISKAYLQKKDIKKAIENAEKSIYYASNFENEKHKTDAYEAYYKALAASGNYKEAYNYLEKFNKANEENFSEEKNTRLVNLRTNFEKENIERELAIEQARKEEINAAQFKQEKLIRNFFIVSFILVSIIIIILFKRYKEKNEQNKKLQETLEKLNKTQTQLLHHEKLASLGRLMAGIAHEIQNPLNFVNNFSELSKELINELNSAHDLEEKEEMIKELKNNLEKINFHGKRADSIVRNMLQHSRKSDVDRQVTDINQFSSEYLNFAYYGYKSSNKDANVKLEKKLNPSLPPIKIIQQDLSRVLINLFNNSFDAIQQKIITNKNGYEPELVLETDYADGKILIKIKDNGSGISDEIKNKIFDPFFTTKPAGAGTGLGLSISNDIVLAHGGKINVKTEDKKYTEFIVELPILN